LPENNSKINEKVPFFDRKVNNDLKYILIIEEVSQINKVRKHKLCETVFFSR